jgi:hypothetical protein
MPAETNRIFLLSPASCSGRRAEILLRDKASFDLANRLRMSAGAALGEVFSFLSGLYFRGKLTYASRFGRAKQGLPTILVITAGRGLLTPTTAVTVEDLRGFASIPIDLRESRYREPIERDCARLAAQLTPDSEVILLGSIASTKYRDVLASSLAPHLRYPHDFIGRGDMSRGGLMLRCVESGQELLYASFSATKLRGKRPAKLAPRRTKCK